MFMGPCDGEFHHPLMTAQSLHERRWHRNEHVEKVSPHQITSTTMIRELPYAATLRTRDHQNRLRL